ncbi:MAG: Na+-dependent transporter [Pseudomonadota bacterium]
METLQHIIPLLITSSLAGLVLAVGLHADRGDVMYVIRRPPLLARAILAVLIVPPVAAWLLVSIAPLDLPVKAGILLMAISPVPPLVPGKELAVGGRKEYAYGLYVAMALLTVVSVPLLVAIAARLFGRDDFVSIRHMAQTVLLGVLLPLAIGIFIRRVAPHFAERAWSVVYKGSMVLVLLAFTPVLVKAWPAFTDLIGNGALLAMAAGTIIALIAGHVLGGPDRRDRATLATAASVRHPGIAMSLAGAFAHDPRVTAAILLFMVVGLVISVPYTMWVRRRSGRAPSTIAHA